MELLETPLAKIRSRRIVKYIPRGGSVCDIGCGAEPKFLLALGNLISEGWGIDKKTITQTWNDRVQTVKEDLDQKSRLPFDNEKFNCVTLLASIEHLAFPRNVLEEAKRVLRTGGIIIVTTPTPLARPILEILAFLGLLSKEEVKDHKHYYYKQALIKLFEGLGFSIVKHQYFELGLNQVIVAKKAI